MAIFAEKGISAKVLSASFSPAQARGADRFYARPSFYD
jgi:hypothetical protein